jgi:PAS domain S-box-containing protein
MDAERHQEIARCLFREANDALLLFDPRNHRVVDVNPTALRLTGFERQRILELRVWDLFSSDELDGVERLVLAYRQTGLFHSREGYYLRRENGPAIPVNISVSRIHTRPDPLGLVVARDISERVRDAAALRESEERYRTLVESAGVLIWTLTPDGTIVSLNPAFETILGWSRDDWVGRPFAVLVHPDDVARAEDLFGRAARGESLPPFELRLRARDGAFRIAEFLTTRPLRTRGRLDVMSIARDVTEIRRAEETIAQAESLRRAKEAAEVASRTKSQFLANVSHELRTPMTAILGFTDILLGTETDADQRRRHLLAIRQNGEFLLDLITDLLDLTKVEVDKLRIESAPCDPARIVDEVVAALRPRAESRGLAVEVAYTSPIPLTVATDATRLRQILINLVSNAIKFTERGEVRLRIGVTETGSELRFDVSDTGIGLSAEEQARLFEAFYRARSVAARGPSGSGLGLVISKRLAEALGGRLEFQSEPRRGSIFSLVLPIGSGPADQRRMPVPGDVAATTETRPIPADVPAVLGTRILLAEDNEASRQVIGLFLEKAGAELVIASNGQEAIDQAIAARDAGQPFDLILMDMQMPVLDGYEATRTLRALGFHQPILALTAYAGDEDRQECLRFGCDDHLSKPIDSSRMLESIAHHLSRRESVVEESSRPEG